MMGPLRSVFDSVLGLPTRMWTSSRAALYRSEAELNDEVAPHLPDTEDLRTISEVDIRVRTRASYPRLGEFYSRQALATINVELVEEAPSYDIVRLQRKLRESDVPVVQVFGDRLVSRGSLGMNETLLFSGRDDSSVEVLIELDADVGNVEKWIRDLDLELFEHLRDVGSAADDGFNLKRYDHGERIATSITAHLERSSRSTALDRLLTRVEDRTDDVTVFRRYEPNWYLERVGGSYHPETILSVSHRYRIDDDWRDGAGTDEKEFTETEASLRWLREFRDNPPDYLDTR